MSSYTKLFSSILDSTIWQEPDHVVRVWIALLAMKDADGIVEASIPGLARRSMKTIAETEDALKRLLAPDPYSRTPDHEGRRIEVLEGGGGWRVLNHDKYRGKESRDEVRERKAKRQARWREKAKAKETPSVDVSVDACRREKTDVTPSDTDTDPNTDPERESPEPPRPVTLQHPPKPPDQTPTPRGGLTLTQRQKINSDVWEEARLAHGLLRSSGIDPHAIPWTAMPSGIAGNDLAARTVELGDMGDETYVRQTHRRVIDVAVAEARREGVKHLRWFTPSRIFDRDSFWKAAELSPEQAAQKRPPPRSTDPPNVVRLKQPDDDSPPIHPAFKKP